MAAAVRLHEMTHWLGGPSRSKRAPLGANSSSLFAIKYPRYQLVLEIPSTVQTGWLDSLIGRCCDCDCAYITIDDLNIYCRMLGPGIEESVYLSTLSGK